VFDYLDVYGDLCQYLLFLHEFSPLIDEFWAVLCDSGLVRTARRSTIKRCGFPHFISCNSEQNWQSYSIFLEIFVINDVAKQWRMTGLLCTLAGVERSPVAHHRLVMKSSCVIVDLRSVKICIIMSSDLFWVILGLELHSNLHKSLHFTRLERIDGIAHSHNQKVEMMTHIFFPIMMIGKWMCVISRHNLVMELLCHLFRLL